MSRKNRNEWQKYLRELYKKIIILFLFILLLEFILIKLLPEMKEEFNAFKEKLNSAFHSNVDLKIDNKGTGKIVIPFKSEEDLSFIMDIFSKLSI